MAKRYMKPVRCGDGLMRTLFSPKTPDEAKYILQIRSKDEDAGFETPCRVWVGCRVGGYGVIVYKGKRKKTSRLIWILNNGPIQERLEACHACDNPACIRLDHLWIGTHKENGQDASKKGRMGLIKGEDHYEGKLTSNQVRFIRFSESLFSRTALAVVFGVSATMIKKIHRGVSWKSV